MFANDADDELEVEPIGEPRLVAPPPELADNIDDVWLRNERELAENDQRFSVSEMLFAIAIGSVAMTLLRLLPSGPAAAVLGILVLVGMLANAFGLLNRLARLAIWVLLILYLFVSVVAIVGG